jgi:hypothetical protein
VGKDRGRSVHRGRCLAAEEYRVGAGGDRGLLDLDGPVSTYLRAGWMSAAGDEPEDHFDQRFWELLMAAAPAARTTDLPSRARPPDGRSIAWAERIIDDPSRAAPP